MSKPVAEMVRDVHGLPVLYLFHLSPAQMRRLKEIMLINGIERVHEARSKAMAHMGQYDSHDGAATIHLHGADAEHYVKFNAMLSSELGVAITDLPIDDYRKLA